MSIIFNGTSGETPAQWTTSTRPATPNTGQYGYNTTTGALDVYNGSAWTSIPMPTSQGTSGQPLVSGGAGASPSYSALSVSAINATGTPSSTTYLRGDATWAAVSGIPTGVVIPYSGSSAPTGWLFCDGSAQSRTTYAALFAVVGTTYGTGDGSTTFNLPDLRGRVVAGVDNMGGTAANRLTSGGSGIAGTTLGAAGGAETFTITTTQMPSHNHSLSGTNDVSGGTRLTFYSSTAGGGSSSTANAGGGGASNVTQPTIVLNYMIKT